MSKAVPPPSTVPLANGDAHLIDKLGRVCDLCFCPFSPEDPAVEIRAGAARDRVFEAHVQCVDIVTTYLAITG